MTPRQHPISLMNTETDNSLKSLLLHVIPLKQTVLIAIYFNMIVLEFFHFHQIRKNSPPTQIFLFSK